MHSLDSIPSHLPSVKIQIMGGKVGLSCKSKTLLGFVNKFFSWQRPAMFCRKKNKKIKCLQLLEGDGIKSRLPIKISSTLNCQRSLWTNPMAHALVLYPLLCLGHHLIIRGQPAMLTRIWCKTLLTFDRFNGKSIVCKIIDCSFTFSDGEISLLRGL